MYWRTTSNGTCAKICAKFCSKTKIARLLRSDSELNPLPDGFDVERLFHAGQSQQAGSIVTYASAFHDDANDGYMVIAGFRARTINSIPGTPVLAEEDRLVRTDLPVPVYQLITQVDFEALNFGTQARQADTPTYRYYEVPGGGHNTVHEDIEIVPAGVLGPDPILLEGLRANPINTTADGPVFVSNIVNALFANMERQARFGRPAPRGVLMDVDETGALVLDEFGNATGGVRVPSIAVPTATYLSGNPAAPGLPPLLTQIGTLACRLSGSVEAFDDATLDELYRSHLRYVFQVKRAVWKLRRQRLILREDARALIRAARASDIGGPPPWRRHGWWWWNRGRH